jgi:hypothetical protein
MGDETIGHYAIEVKLGEGGVGEVFRALDPMLGRQVAVKRLRPELASREDVAERFQAEAKTLARLNHPNIATLYSFERDGDALFMVMEYVEGETVSSILRRMGALPLERALGVFVQALEGIGYAHERGVVHRDIKASNLILSPEGLVKVMDFGIARVLGSERVTLLGQLVGTPEYMSPEQIRGEETDVRSDVYALGALLYALLAGRLPFTARSDFDLLRAHVESEPPPLGPIAGGGPSLEAAILRALAKDPAARFQSVADFRSALEPSFPAAGFGERDSLARALAAPAPRAAAVSLRSSAEPTRVIPEAEDGAEERPDEAALDAGEPVSTRGPETDADPLDEAPTTTLASPSRRRAAGRVRAAIWASAVLVLGLNLLAVHPRPEPEPRAEVSAALESQEPDEAALPAQAAPADAASGASAAEEADPPAAASGSAGPTLSPSPRPAERAEAAARRAPAATPRRPASPDARRSSRGRTTAQEGSSSPREKPHGQEWVIRRD